MPYSAQFLASVSTWASAAGDELRLNGDVALDGPPEAGQGPLAFRSDSLIVYPKEPRPSYADQVLSLLHRHDVRPVEVQEVREIQTALGLVAAEAGVCIIPSSARQMRSDVHYRLLEGEGATSPVILNHRVGDTSVYIDLVKKLIAEMYAENPPLSTSCCTFPPGEK